MHETPQYTQTLTWQRLSLFYATQWIYYEWYSPLAEHYSEYSLFQDSPARREELDTLSRCLDSQYQ